MNNYIILVHGMFVSIMDVVNKLDGVKHISHPDIKNKEEGDYFDFQYEPTHIWL